jgi:hypothetical protein
MMTSSTLSHVREGGGKVEVGIKSYQLPLQKHAMLRTLGTSEQALSELRRGKQGQHLVRVRCA